MKNINEAFTPEESKKVYDNFLAIVNDQKRRDKLVKKHGSNAEAVAYGTAVNQVKKQSSEKKPEEKMDKTEKLKEMVKDALMNPKKADLNKDGKLSDYEKKRGAAIEKAIQKEDETTEKGIIDEPISEDLDLGHTDNEPHMLKGDLYRIGKYAMELYKMVDKFDKMDSEVDFPHWWQSKIIKAKEMLVSAKHYLDFETKESEIDAMVGVASEEEVIDESSDKEAAWEKFQKDKGVTSKTVKVARQDFEKEWEQKSKSLSEKFASKAQQKYLYATNPKAAKKLGSKMGKKDYKNLPEKVKEAIIAKLQESKGEYAKIEKQIADLKLKGKNAGDAEMQKLIKRRAELEKSKK